MKKQEAMWGYIFIAPAVIGLLIFAVWPILQSFFLSLHEWIGFGEKTFIGLDNFKIILQNKEIYDSIINTFRITIFALPISIMISLIIANMLNSPTVRGKGIFRVIFYLPIVTMPAAIAVVFKYIFNYNYGIINEILKFFNLEAVEWLSNAKYSWIVIVCILIWSVIGTQIIILLAALQNIDYSIYEAADIDGASALKKFFYITLPEIKDTILINMIITITGSIREYDEVFVTTNGGPGYASETLATYLYKVGFRNDQMGYASAIAFFIFIVTFAIGLLQMKGYKLDE